MQAITARYTGAYHLAKRTTPSVMDDLCGLPMSLGTIANLEQATALALIAPVAEAQAYGQAQPVAYLDETGWREGQQRAWRWTAVTAWVTAVVVRLSRRSKVAQDLLGERFGGWLVPDRWSASTWYPAWRRQFCWAPRRRDIEAMIARGGRSREIGEAWRAQARQLFPWWHRVREGTLAHASVASSRPPMRHEVERGLDEGQTGGVPKTGGGCRELRKRRPAWWTFVRHEGVEPTKNAAARALRPGVLWRQGSVGTQSPEGSRVVETMLTVVATLTQQHRHVLAYVTAACEAALRREAAPAVLPTAALTEELLCPAAELDHRGERLPSKEQEREGFSIPAQLKLLHEYAVERSFHVIKEFIDVETAKTAGRTQFGEMAKFLQTQKEARIILVETTDRLYRNFKDYVALEDLDLVVHLVKEHEVLSKDSRSHTKFIHGIQVLMAKNYIDNLSEETKKGMREKAEQGHYPSFAPLGYQNNLATKRIELDPEVAPLMMLTGAFCGASPQR